MPTLMPTHLTAVRESASQSFESYWFRFSKRAIICCCFAVFSKESACNHRWCVRAASSLPSRASEKHAGGAGDGHGPQADRHRAQDPKLQSAAARCQGRHPDPAGASQWDGPPRLPGGRSCNFREVCVRPALWRNVQKGFGLLGIYGINIDVMHFNVRNVFSKGAEAADILEKVQIWATAWTNPWTDGALGLK